MRRPPVVKLTFTEITVLSIGPTQTSVDHGDGRSSVRSQVDKLATVGSGRRRGEVTSAAGWSPRQVGAGGQRSLSGKAGAASKLLNKNVS